MLTTGAQFEGLKILDYCGSGGFGTVYLCEDPSGKRFALKVISKYSLGNAWERELKGIRNYRKLSEDTTGLLKLYHVGENQEYFYYTMEPADALPEGKKYLPDTLASRLTAGPLPQEQLFSILGTILNGIQILHEAGFAHRDLKPENILFVNGNPRIADLGLLSPLSETMTQLAGTLDFLPPEARSGEASFDIPGSRQRNDLYAFGKLIYCSITGKNANAFPSTPAEMPMTLANKFLYRLSLRLCDKVPERRLTSLTGLLCAFEKARQMTQKGETVGDKISYFLSTSRRNFSYNLLNCLRGIRQHWVLSLFLAIVLGTVTWHLWPRAPYDITQEKTKTYTRDDSRAPYDITQEKTKTYTRDDLGFSMEIPIEWEVLTAQSVLKMLNEANEEEEPISDLEKKRLEFFIMMAEQGCDYITCDYDENFSDNVSVQTVEIPGEYFNQLSDDELRVHMLELTRGELEFDTKIYDLKHLTLAGKPCIFIDLSHDDTTRINNYIFALEDKCFSITLVSKRSTFFTRQEEFNEVLSTLSFKK